MKSHNGLFVNLALMVIGVGIALVLVDFTLRTFPELVPDQVPVNPPVRRVKASIDEIYVLRHSDGDLLYWMRGAFPPIPQDEDAVISRVHMIIDAHGFRNPPPERTTYEIVALGDSYTRGSLVEAPWPENLAELTGYTVINLADVGFGPQEEFDTLRRYGIEKKPQWVVLAYFEGNDLYDAAAYEQSNPFFFLRLGKFMLTQSIEAWQRRSDVIASRAVAPNYRYPIELNLNNSTQDMVFFSPYISWLTPDRHAIETSLNYRLVKQTLSEIMELSLQPQRLERARVRWRELSHESGHRGGRHGRCAPGIGAPGGQLKLCFPLGLSHAAVRSRTPVASFSTSRFSL